MAGISSFSKTVVLKPTAAKAATGNGNEIVIPEGVSDVIFLVDVTAASGTSPTLDLKIQDAVRNVAATDVEGAVATGTLVWNDYAAFTQITGTTQREMAAKIASTAEYAVADGTLAAGTVRSGPFGNRIRAKWVIGGTNPSFTFSITALLLG